MHQNQLSIRTKGKKCIQNMRKHIIQSHMINKSLVWCWFFRTVYASENIHWNCRSVTVRVVVNMEACVHIRTHAATKCDRESERVRSKCECLDTRAQSCPISRTFRFRSCSKQVECVNTLCIIGTSVVVHSRVYTKIQISNEYRTMTATVLMFNRTVVSQK